MFQWVSFKNTLGDRSFMTIENLPQEARDSIGDYCMHDCRGKCCRTEMVDLATTKELDFVTEGKPEKWSDKGYLAGSESGWAISFREVPCVHYVAEDDSARWEAHESESRPAACKEYPLFVYGRTVELAKICPGLLEDNVRPLLKKMREMGYSVEIV